MKEKDLELLYYNPTQKVAEEQPIQPVSQTPVKKTDKYGFYTSNSESSSLKHSKIVKEEKMALKWLEVIKNWDETRSKKVKQNSTLRTIKQYLNTNYYYYYYYLLLLLLLLFCYYCLNIVLLFNY